MPNGDMTLSLRDARALLETSGKPAAATVRRLERAVRRAERELLPGRWAAHEFYGDTWLRSWPAPSTTVAAWVDAGGWDVRTPDFALVASGPSTGAAGRQLADRALRRWLRRRGVEWEPETNGRTR